jgi:2-polyprenyl-6-methoxyphenol hydroxylase-like FAD-dependent oxidoreductase
VQPATLIGADGAHSTVRKGLGIGFGGESFPGEWGLADVVLADWPFPFDRPVITLDRHHICAFIPMAEGFGRFVSNDADVLDRLPPDAKVKSVVWQSTFRISFRQVSTYQQDNAFLAGDAAHIHSPVGARGMNLGIEDACWLAWLMAEGRTQEYTALRWPAGRTVLDFTEQQTRQIVRAACGPTCCAAGSPPPSSRCRPCAAACSPGWPGSTPRPRHGSAPEAGKAKPLPRRAKSGDDAPNDNPRERKP